MSVSDPLIKDVKGCVQKFIGLINEGIEITDNNKDFVRFTQTLEKIFNKGLIRQHNTKFFERTINCFAWLSSIARGVSTNGNFAYNYCVEQVKERNDVATNEGRFRLLIKYCLSKKCLHVPVEVLTESNHAQVFYVANSILGDEVLLEILLSVLRQVSKLSFNLDLENASFLDVSWYVPEIVEVELVPCSQLGIAISFAGNKAVIVNVEPDGVAAENGNVKIGDILDRLNGNQVNKSSKGKLGLMMKINNSKLRPVKLRLAKAYDQRTSEWYDPIKVILKVLKIDLDAIKRQYNETGTDFCNNKKTSTYGYPVKYLGKVEVGSLGSVKQVQKALKSLLDNQTVNGLIVKRIDQDAALEIGEIALKIRNKETSELLVEHSYMNISACGNVPVWPKVFGYCAGEETCDVAKSFVCYIFESGSIDDADLILQSIGQGFHRTHFAV